MKSWRPWCSFLMHGMQIADHVLRHPRSLGLQHLNTVP
jgi:hypothetical protein